MSGTNSITRVEVGPRDGFQSIKRIINTEQKLRLIDRLYDAGIRRMEATAFVSDSAVPQFADAAQVLQHAQTLPGMDAQVLAPNARHAERALTAGAKHLAFVLSVSEKHNKNNVRRSALDSANEYTSTTAMLPADVLIRLNIATAFDCPYDGAVNPARTLHLMECLLRAKSDEEVCLCDTTGRVTPDRVTSLFIEARERFPDIEDWAFHGHYTYGLGVANAIAARNAGVSVLDASFAGLGGCPFAPGATGNISSEDIVWTFEQMKVGTGIDFEKLLSAAHEGAALPGATYGGRVRNAISSSQCSPVAI
jgi:hydroxymethylglutaryl-CoA lyase